MSEIVAETPAGASSEADGLQTADGGMAPAVPSDAALPPNHPDSQSPTMIRLFIRPAKGKTFERGFQEAGAAAGLTHPGLEGIHNCGKGYLQVSGSLAACCEDTGHALVWFSPDRRYAKMPFAGELREVCVSVDPRNCPMPGVRSSLQRSFRSGIEGLMKELGDAVLVDGLGQPISEDDMGGISSQLQAAMRARATELERQATTSLGGGRFRIQGALSFQHEIETRGPRGAVKSYEKVLFDAPALPWGAGRARGAEMANEHIAWLRSHRYDDARLAETLRAAFLARTQNQVRDAWPSRAHTAAGYIDLMTKFLAAGARVLNPEWVEWNVNEARKDQQWHDRSLAANKARVKEARMPTKSTRKSGAA